MYKTYVLKNGYKISKGEFYDGYDSQIRWCVYTPNGEFFRSFGSYNKAYECAKKGDGDNDYL